MILIDLGIFNRLRETPEGASFAGCGDGFCILSCTGSYESSESLYGWGSERTSFSRAGTWRTSSSTDFRESTPRPGPEFSLEGL